jgi:hypothetical protein
MIIKCRSLISPQSKKQENQKSSSYRESSSEVILEEGLLHVNIEVACFRIIDVRVIERKIILALV